MEKDLQEHHLVYELHFDYLISRKWIKDQKVNILVSSGESMSKKMRLVTQRLFPDAKDFNFLGLDYKGEVYK